MPKRFHMNGYFLGTTVILPAPQLKTRNRIECWRSELLTAKHNCDNMYLNLLSRLARIDIKRRAWGPQMLRENVHPHL